MSCYWIFTITILATYTGNLVAFMTVQKLKLPINDLEELADHPEYQAGLARGTSTSDLFKVCITFHKFNFSSHSKFYIEFIFLRIILA